MAIHSDFPGVTVQVVVNDEPLEEYVNEEEEDPPKTLTRYIECQSGAEFAIKTSFTENFDPTDMSLRAYLDGVMVSKWFVVKEDVTRPMGFVQASSRWKDGTKWYQSMFSFSELELGKCQRYCTFIYMILVVDIKYSRGY